MSYDIYGNILRRGYCEVHPDIPESYPCYLCYEENQRSYEDPPQQPGPTNFDYIGFSRLEFLTICGEIIEASNSEDSEIQNKSIESLINFLNPGYVSSILNKIIQGGT